MSKKELYLNWHDEAKDLYAKGYTKIEVYNILVNRHGKAFTATYNTVKSYLYRHRKDISVSDADPIVKNMEQGYYEIEDIDEIAEYCANDVTITDEVYKSWKDHEDKKFVAIQNWKIKEHDNDWNGNRVIKFGLMGDTQMGSKYAQITYLHDFYDTCLIEGVSEVYHTGDITDGLKMRVGHEYELYENSADGQIADVVKNYPKREGITTYFITGNHDAALYKQVGLDVGTIIESKRDDMIYLGRDCAVVNLTPNCTLELRHPWDGTAYALSYKPQKMIEAMESDSKPSIIAIGHYHKAEYLFYRNVHCFQTGCFQSQTPFTRGKGISVHVGGWIITVHVSPDGTIQRCCGEFIPYYKSIKDDYKNYLF